MRLLLLLSLLLPILPPGAHLCGLVFATESTPCEEIVTLGEAQEGVAPLLQKNYRVPHVVVHEVNLECAADCCPT